MKLNSPPVRRDWSDTGPGDSTVCDDATPDHAIYGPVELPLSFEEDPKFGIFVGRMEVLFAVDERTDYPQAFVIILGEPEFGALPQQKAHYNQVHQRLLFLRQHDRIGLPHAQWKLENGPWRNRLNDGDKVNEWENINYARFANGLAEATGRRIRHTDPGNPRSKIVERIFGAVWDRMKCQRAYLGNNERLDKREAIQDFIARVKARKEDPRNELLHVSEFKELLSRELMAFANEPQNGQRLPGVSPLEAWTNGIDGHPGYEAKPLQQLWGTARFLLSTHERFATVNLQNGITVKIGQTPYYFWGQELEPYQREKILCRFNFEEPEILSCCPPGGKPFTVKGRILPANTATKKELSEVGRARASWKRRGKVIFDNLPHPFSFTVSRETGHPADVKRFGEEYERQVQDFQAEKSKTVRQVGRARQKAVQAGFDPSHLRLRNPEAVAQAAGRITERLAALRQKEARQLQTSND